MERLILRWSVLSEPRVLLEAYLAMRGKSFLYALLFTIVVHELYNFTVVMGNAYTYDRFFY